MKTKRVPREQHGAPAAPAGKVEDGTVQVVRIDDYDETGSGAQDDTGGLHVAEPAHAEPEPAAGGEGDGTTPGSPPADPISGDGEPANWRTRLRERRAAATSRSARGEWQHPLGI